MNRNNAMAVVTHIGQRAQKQGQKYREKREHMRGKSHKKEQKTFYAEVNISQGSAKIGSTLSNVIPKMHKPETYVISYCPHLFHLHSN